MKKLMIALIASLILASPVMAVEFHQQNSSKQRFLYPCEITESPAGTLNIAACEVWAHGDSFQVPAYSTVVGSGPFRIHLEIAEDLRSLDYVLDMTGYAEPRMIATVGAPVVVWRNRTGEDIHALVSVEQPD